MGKTRARTIVVSTLMVLCVFPMVFAASLLQERMVIQNQAIAPKVKLLDDTSGTTTTNTENTQANTSITGLSAIVYNNYLKINNTNNTPMTVQVTVISQSNLLVTDSLSIRVYNGINTTLPIVITTLTSLPISTTNITIPANTVGNIQFLGLIVSGNANLQMQISINQNAAATLVYDYTAHT